MLKLIICRKFDHKELQKDKTESKLGSNELSKWNNVGSKCWIRLTNLLEHVAKHSLQVTTTSWWFEKQHVSSLFWYLKGHVEQTNMECHFFPNFDLLLSTIYYLFRGPLLLIAKVTSAPGITWLASVHSVLRLITTHFHHMLIFQTLLPLAKRLLTIHYLSQNIMLVDDPYRVLWFGKELQEKSKGIENSWTWTLYPVYV